MRVVVEAGALSDGRAEAGVGRYVASLIEALAAVADDEGVTLTVARPRRPSPTERRPLRWLRAQPSVALAGARRRAALLHAPGGEPSPVWPPHRQVVTVHDLESLVGPGPLPGASLPGRAALRGLARAYAGLTALLIRRCAAVIAVSEPVAAQTAAVLGVPPDRVRVVPEGVSPVFRPGPAGDEADRRARLGLAGRPYLLWTGTLVAHDPRKALDLLLEAVAVTRRDRPETVLVMAGRTGAEAGRVAARAARLGVPLTLTGWVSDADLAVLLRGCSAAVVPSLHEGFGLPALEAMACGAPLVATAAGNLAGLVGDAGLLCPPGDVRALAEALEAVLDAAAATSGRLRAAGPRRAAPYTWDRAARATAAVYRAVARGAPAEPGRRRPDRAPGRYPPAP